MNNQNDYILKRTDRSFSLELHSYNNQYQIV